MGEKVWVQCARCGALSQVRNKDASLSDDYIYTEPIWCDRCRDETKHLLIGEHRDDVYETGDTFLDERYFIY